MNKTNGQRAYDAYREHTGGKTFDGRDIPAWEWLAEHNPRILGAWEAAGVAVYRDAVKGTHRDPSPEPLTTGGTFTFAEALRYLKAGRRCARSGWNGKGMWIALTPGSVIDKKDARAGAARLLVQAQPPDPEGMTLTIGAHIDMKASDGSLVIGWLASQTDMLAEDWTLLPEAHALLGGGR